MIRDLVGEREVEEIQEGNLRRAALLWHYTVLGEAASQVPSELRASHPTSPGVAARLRNRIVHGYWNIDVATLVATAADDLPQVVDDLENLIEALRPVGDSDPPA